MLKPTLRSLSQMFKNKIRLILLMIIVIPMVWVGCSTINTSPDSASFSFAESSQNVGNSLYFTLFFKSNTLVIWDNPRFAWDDKNINLYDIEWQILDLSELLEEGYTFVESLAYASYEDDLIIVFVSSNFTFSGSKIARIDGETLTPKWVTDFSGVNIGLPIVKNNYLYVSSIGSIGKLDVDTGEFLWKHTELYDHDTQDFNSFKMAVFDDTKVIFQGRNPMSACPKRVEVNDDTGSILNIVKDC